MRRILLSLPLFLLALLFALPALAGNWGENWGTLTWGAAIAAVPTMGKLAVLVLALGLGGLAARFIQQSRAAASLLVIAFVLPMLSPVANAQTESVPHTFSDGSVADADEVNENFAALVAAVQELQGRTFLTTDACPAGYDAVEDGYIKLGATGLTTTASSRTLSNPGHGHSHSLQNAPYAGHLGMGSLGLGGDGDDQALAFPLQPRGAHNHTITGSVGAAGVAGDTPQDITGDLEHITLRLCVRSS